MIRIGGTGMCSQKGGRCPIPGDFQGEAGSGPEQPDLAMDVPIHCRGVGLDGLLRVPSNSNNSIIL